MKSTDVLNAHRAPRIACAALALLLGGCNWLVPFIFIGEHKRTVPAEFHRLESHRTLILVWADQATLFDYPHIRLELASYLKDKLQAKIKKCDIIEPVKVEDYVNRTLDADVDPAATGKHFAVDYVVYIELVAFQIRDPRSPDLVQGRARASVYVHDLTTRADLPARFILDPVEIAYPENQPVLMSARTALLVRQQTYQAVTEMIARKFYDYQVDL